jgi:hypothetical protein
MEIVFDEKIGSWAEYAETLTVLIRLSPQKDA